MHLKNVTLFAVNVINWLYVPSKCSLYSIAANSSQHVRVLRVIYMRVVVCASSSASGESSLGAHKTPPALSALWCVQDATM